MSASSITALAHSVQVRLKNAATVAGRPFVELLELYAVERFLHRRAQPDDIAFIQFSSGSTSQPKGVVLTHHNLIANIRGATEAAGFDENDLSLSWMPLTHDMGLIGFHLYMFANRMQRSEGHV